MSVGSPCPRPEDWQALLDGTVDDSRELALAAHLEACEPCRRELDRLAGDRQLIDDVGERLREVSPVTEPGLERVMAGLRSGTPSGSTSQDRTAPEHPGYDVRSWLQASDDPRLLGTLDEYDVLGVLGRGGMGIVLLAHDRTLNRRVALKLLAPHLAHDARCRKRFTREARAVAAVNHRHIVTIHRIVEPSEEARFSLPYLVTEFVAGNTLETRLRTEGPLPIEDVVDYAAQIADGLAAAHERGIIHRDIKPGNILLSADGRECKISDFGLARIERDGQQTASGMLTGTPAYMSPEQARGLELDSRSDLFSLGSLVFAMLAGRAPFEGSSSLSIIHQILDGPVPQVERVQPGTPVWLAEIVNRLHAQDPDRRFQTAEQVRIALESRETHTLPSAAAAAGRRRQSDRKRLVRRGLIGTAVAAVVCLVGYGLFQLTHGPEVDPGLAGRRSEQSEEVPVVAGEGAGPPFVLQRAGETVARYVTLEAALAAAGGPGVRDSVIEIDSDELIEVTAVRVDGAGMVLRAAAGRRPHLRLVGADRAPALIEAFGRLVLEGLIIEVPVTDFPRVPHAVFVHNGPFYATNCRILLPAGSACIKLDHCFDAEIRNCELHADRGAGVEWSAGVDGVLDLMNNVHTGELALALNFQPGSAGRPAVRLQRSTWLTRYGIDVRSGSEPWGNGLGQPVAVLAAQTVFDHAGSLIRIDTQWNGGQSQQAMLPFEKPEWLRRRLMWRDEWNLFGASGAFFEWAHPSRPQQRLPWVPVSLSDWSQFWGQPLPPRAVVQLVRYRAPERGGLAEPDEGDAGGEQVRFEVLNRLPGPVANLRLGPEVSWLGPGAAYARWRATGELEAWERRKQGAERRMPRRGPFPPGRE